MLTTLGEKLTDDEVDALLSNITIDSTGSVNYEGALPPSMIVTALTFLFHTHFFPTSFLLSISAVEFVRTVMSG